MVLHMSAASQCLALRRLVAFSMQKSHWVPLFFFLARLGGNLLSVPEVNLSLERLDYLKVPGIVKFLLKKKGNLSNKRVLASVGLKPSICCTIWVSIMRIHMF